MIFKEEIKMEELKTEMNEMTMVEEITDFDEEYVGESRGIFKKVVVIGGGALTAGAVALAVKKRDKIKAKLEDRKIAKLEKKGYVVCRPEDVCEVADFDETDEDDEN